MINEGQLFNIIYIMRSYLIIGKVFKVTRRTISNWDSGKVKPPLNAKVIFLDKMKIKNP
jgi:hypothetical protein